jgi:hypothetical protein
MVDFNDDTNGRQGSDEYPDATPPQGYEAHPLFPREDGSPESRDIHFISFRRRRTDGRIDNCPEDIRAGEVHTWAQVVGPWGGGEYKAIGKDRNHRVVAWYPEKHGEWLLFDSDSRPFTLRDQRYAHSPPAAAAAPPAPLAPPALTPMDSALHDLVRENRSSPMPFPRDAVIAAMTKSQEERHMFDELWDRHHRPAAAPPAPLAPPALTPIEYALLDVVQKDRASQASSTFSTETALLEMIKSHEERQTLREQWDRHIPPAAAPPAPLAPPALTPVEYALLDLVRELRASQASSTFSMQAAMVEMIKSQGEILRIALSAAPPKGVAATVPQPTAEEKALAEQLAHAAQESSPKPQGEVAATHGVSARRRYAASRRRDVRGRWQKP